MIKPTLNNLLVILFLVAIGLGGCTETSPSKNESIDTTSNDKSIQLIQAMEKVNGGWNSLLKLKDVEYTYKYDDKNKGIDLSTERYIFQDESSWAEYNQHNVNVMPGVEGKVQQSLVDGNPKIMMDGQEITDEAAIAGTSFLRHANFYWFTMMYKLNDPNAIHNYLGKEDVNGISYDKVAIKYKETGKVADDEYILYFNPSTHLVDQFYFSLPAFGVNDPIIRMELKYKEIDGVYIATHRKGFFPDENGNYVLGGEYTSTNIKFGNGFTKSDLSL